jgi:hypothetical protein
VLNHLTTDNYIEGFCHERQNVHLAVEPQRWKLKSLATIFGADQDWTGPRELRPIYAYELNGRTELENQRAQQIRLSAQFQNVLARTSFADGLYHARKSNEVILNIGCVGLLLLINI